jgi:hypothetical protein
MEKCRRSNQALQPTPKAFASRLAGRVYDSVNGYQLVIGSWDSLALFPPMAKPRLVTQTAVSQVGRLRLKDREHE